MKNIQMEVDKNKILTIKIDLNESHGASKSGKSITIATTEGNAALTGELNNIKVGINVYKSIDS